MNLWVKRTGQLLVAVLFLMSCEDDSFLLGFRNQNKKFNVRYQELTLPSSVLSIDSVITDNLDGNPRLLIGQYNDLRFGTVRAEAFTQLFPLSVTKLDPTAVYDSVTIKLRLDFYSYGAEGESEERFTIHEITQDSLSFYKRYYYNTTIGYDLTPLAETTYTVKYDTLKKNLSLGANADTLLFKAKLTDAFGLKLFNLALNDTDSSFSKRKEFSYAVKGLALIPSQSNMVIGISTTSVSEVTLHYHTAAEDSLERAFRFGSSIGAVGFNNINTNRIGDLATITQSYEGYAPPGGLRYLQNGSPVITKIDISEYYDFITGSLDGVNDSLTNIAINSAEISMDIETPPAGTPPLSTLTLKVMKVENGKDLFANSTIYEDSVAVAGFQLFTSNRHYLPIDDTFGQPVTLTRTADETKYSAFVTLFMQNLFDRKEEDRKNGVVTPKQIYYLGVVPTAPTPGKTVDRSVLNPNSIKLKIYYTKTILSNL